MKSAPGKPGGAGSMLFGAMCTRDDLLGGSQIARGTPGAASPTIWAQGAACYFEAVRISARGSILFFMSKNKKRN